MIRLHGCRFQGAGRRHNCLLRLPSYLGTVVESGRYFQYRVSFSGSGDACPSVRNVVVSFAQGSHEIHDSTMADFSQGKQTRQPQVYGEEIRLPDFASLGPGT